MTAILIAFYLGGVASEAACQLAMGVGFYLASMLLWPVYAVIAMYDLFRSRLGRAR